MEVYIVGRYDRFGGPLDGEQRELVRDDMKVLERRIDVLCTQSCEPGNQESDGEESGSRRHLLDFGRGRSPKTSSRRRQETARAGDGRHATVDRENITHTIDTADPHYAEDSSLHRTPIYTEVFSTP